MVEWETALPLWILDALFLAVFVLAGLHARRLIEKEAAFWDYGGFAGVWLLAIAWAMHRLGAGLLALLLVATAILASGLPMARGARRIAQEKSVD